MYSGKTKITNINDIISLK